jgi:hypothetical protein
MHMYVCIMLEFFLITVKNKQEKKTKPCVWVHGSDNKKKTRKKRTSSLRLHV